MGIGQTYLSQQVIATQSDRCHPGRPDGRVGGHERAGADTTLMLHGGPTSSMDQVNKYLGLGKGALSDLWPASGILKPIGGSLSV
jgi:hypothetical protein